MYYVQRKIYNHKTTRYLRLDIVRSTIRHVYIVIWLHTMYEVTNRTNNRINAAAGNLRNFITPSLSPSISRIEVKQLVGVYNIVES